MKALKHGLTIVSIVSLVICVINPVFADVVEQTKADGHFTLYAYASIQGPAKDAVFHTGQPGKVFCPVSYSCEHRVSVTPDGQNSQATFSFAAWLYLDSMDGTLLDSYQSDGYTIPANSTDAWNRSHTTSRSDYNTHAGGHTAGGRTRLMHAQGIQNEVTDLHSFTVIMP